MKRSEIRGSSFGGPGFPDCASLHPGYAFLLRSVTGMMTVSEKMHQRTCQQQQVGQRGKGVTRMRRQQVDAKRGNHKRYDQPRPGAEKTIERIHELFQTSVNAHLNTARRSG
jgi:hypothetical protein